MSEVIQSVDRPDVNCVAPKMQAVALLAQSLNVNLGTFKAGASDNIMSGVDVRGTFDSRESWVNGIFHNAEYFIFMIKPADGKRYYEEGQETCVELLSCGHKITQVKKFRKYTGTPEKCVEKIQQWLTANKG